MNNNNTNEEILAELRRINNRYDARAAVDAGCMSTFFFMLVFIFLGTIVAIISSNSPIIEMFGANASGYLVVGVFILATTIKLFASAIGRAADASRVKVDAEFLMVGMVFPVIGLASLSGLSDPDIPRILGPNWACYVFCGAFILYFAFWGLMMWIFKKM